MNLIILSETECRIAELIGRKRREISLKYGRDKSRHDFTPDGIQNDIESVAAEMAVAKHLNIYPEWSPTPGEVPKFDLRWLDRKVDVKSTQKSNGNLLIPNLNESLIYFFVRARMPKYQIVGKIEGENVPIVGRWIEQLPHRPAWLVSADKLKG